MSYEPPLHVLWPFLLYHLNYLPSLSFSFMCKLLNISMISKTWCFQTETIWKISFRFLCSRIIFVVFHRKQHHDFLTIETLKANFCDNYELDLQKNIFLCMSLCIKCSIKTTLGYLMVIYGANVDIFLRYEVSQMKNG